MKLLINTCLNPFFVALFDEANQNVAQESWTNPKESGARIWDFFENNRINTHSFSLIGGLDSPGTFSQLRTAGTILNTLSLTHQIPVHQIGAGALTSTWLQENQIQALPAFDSFGSTFFVYQNQELEHFESVEDLPETLQNQTFYTAFLSDKKASSLKKTVCEPRPDLPTVLLKTLLQIKPEDSFIPHYYLPAIRQVKAKV